MTKLKCSVGGCTFETEDVEATIALELLKVHDRHHPVTVSNNTCKVEKVRRPVVTSSGTSEDWRYFLQRWEEYKKATGIQGEELVLQLLECCEETLRRDLSRNNASGLTGKS